MPRLGKRKNYIGVSVLDGKRSGRKQLPSWCWKEGDSWHYIKIYKNSLLYTVVKLVPKAAIELRPPRSSIDDIIRYLVNFLNRYNIVVSERQIMISRNLALQGETVIVAPVDHLILKSYVSPVESVKLQPKQIRYLKINEEAAKRLSAKFKPMT